MWSIDVVKTYRNAEVKHSILMREKPEEMDEESFFYDYIKDWADREGGGMNYGYKCEWEIREIKPLSESISDLITF